MHAVIEIPGRTSALAQARSIVDAVLTAWALPERSADAQLLAHELLANAIEHAPGLETYELELAQDGERLRISVADGSSVQPVIAELDRDRPHGRGLQLVEALSTSWGSDEHLGGKRVWVTF